MTFNKETHTYTSDYGDKLISVTQLLEKHGIAPSYDNVDKELLRMAAERGTIIHEEVENFVKNHEVGFTQEAMLIAKELLERNIEGECEKIVGNEIVAGTADFIGTENGYPVVLDFKTGSQKHLYAWSWQVSLYAYLEGINSAIKQIWWTHDGKLEILDAMEISKENIEILLDCEYSGKIYGSELVTDADSLQQLRDICAERIAKEAEVKALKEKEESLKLLVINSMESKNIKNTHFKDLRITYVPSGVRKKIDEEKLRKDFPALDEYYMETKTKASLRLTLKEDK